MRTSRAARIALGIALGTALVGAGVGAANAATDPVTPGPLFGGTLYLADGNDLTDITATTLAYNTQVVAEVAQGDQDSNFPIPAGTTSAKTFIAPVGQEGTVSAWNATGFVGLTAGGISLPNVTPINFGTPGAGSPQGTNAVKAAGGDYSVGLAFLSNNNLTIQPGGLYYIHVHITAGTGAYTYAQVSGGSGGGPTTPPATPVDGSPKGQDLAAQVVAPAVVDGVLSLVAPAASTSTIGNPAIVGGLSTSTGALGHLTVSDGRAASKPGWTLTTTAVAAFTNAGKTIANTQLGLAPKNISGIAAALGTPQVAGSATYPSKFAELAAGTAGDSVLDADLKFVAPTGSTAGTYTSTLTLTLVSK